MKREILFRGKTIYSGIWVEGDLVQRTDADGSKHYLIENNEFSEYRSYEVIPESVGQFTGLLDKNGKRIFEGDILKLTYDGYSFNCEVKFKDGAFLVYKDNAFNGGDADMTLIGWLKHDDYVFEIIGNIHDK